MCYFFLDVSQLIEFILDKLQNRTFFILKKPNLHVQNVRISIVLMVIITFYMFLFQNKE